MAQRNISTKLAITGESEYRHALSQINNELKTLQSDLKLVESEFEGNANSMEALTAKGEALQRIFDEQNTKVEELQKALSNANKAEEEYASQRDAIKEAIDKNNEALEKLRESTEDTSEEEAKLTAENEKLNAELENCEAKLEAAHSGVLNWQRQLNNAEIQLNNTNAAIEENNGYLEEAKNSADNCAHSIDAYGKKVSEASSETDAIGDSFNALSQILGAVGIAASFDEITAALKDMCNEMQEAQQTIVRATGASGQALADMNSIALSVFSRSTAESLNDIAGIIGELNTRLNLSGTELENATVLMERYAQATGTNGTSAVASITQVMKNYGVEVSEMESLLDKLTVAGQASGISVDSLSDALVTNKATLIQMGYSLEDSIALLSMMEKEGLNSSSVLMGFRTAIGKVSGEGVNTKEALQEVIDKIKNMSDESEATSFAVETFGSRAGVELANAIRTGRFELDDWIKVIENSEGVMLQTAEASETMEQKMQRASNNLKSAFMEALGPSVENVQGKIAEFVNSIGDFVRDHPKATEAITAIVTALTGVVTVLSTIKAVKAAANLLDIAGTIGEIGNAASSAAGAFTTFIANAGGIAGALGALAGPAAIAATALAGVVAVMDEVKTIQDIGFLGEGHTIEEYAGNVQHYKDEIVRLKEEYENLANCGGDLTIVQNELDHATIGLQHATEEYTAAQEAANQAQEDGLAAAQNSVASAENQAAANLAITGSLEEIAVSYKEAYDACRESLNGQIGLFDAFATKVDEETDTAVEMLKRWGEQTTNLQLYTENLKRAGELGLDQGLVQSLADGSSQSAGYLAIMIQEIDNCAQGTGTLGTSAEEAVSKFNEAFKGTEAAKDNLATTMTTINQDLDASLREMEQKAAAVNFDGFWDAVDAAFKDVGVNFREIGVNIGTGTQSGIEDSASAVADAASSMMDETVKAAKQTVGVNSPSTVFREIGQNLDTGLLQGIESGSEEIIGAVNSMGTEIVQSMTQSGEQASSMFVSTLDQMSASVSAVLSGIGYSVQAAMSFLPENMFYIGMMTIDGMINGLYSESGALYSAMYSIVSQSIQTARDAAAVASPSKKAKEIFEFIGEGMIIGIESKKHDVEEATEDVVKSALFIDPSMIRDMSNAISSAVPDYSRLIGDAGYEPGTSPAGVGNTIYNNIDMTINTQPGQDEKEIADYVLDRMGIELERVQGAY